MCSTSVLPDGGSPPRSARPGEHAAVALERCDQETYRVLVDVVRLAARAVPGCDAASITLLHEAVPRTAAATDHRAHEVDSAQCRRSDGPSLLAIRTGAPVLVD